MYRLFLYIPVLMSIFIVGVLLNFMFTGSACNCSGVIDMSGEDSMTLVSMFAEILSLTLYVFIIISYYSRVKYAQKFKKDRINGKGETYKVLKLNEEYSFTLELGTFYSIVILIFHFNIKAMCLSSFIIFVSIPLLYLIYLYLKRKQSVFFMKI